MVIKVGPNDTEINVAERTTSAVIDAARAAVESSLNVEDIREIGEWTGYVNEHTWIPYTDGKRDDLTIVGVVAVWIACALVGVDYPDGVDDDADAAFVDSVWDAAPRRKVGAR